MTGKKTFISTSSIFSGLLVFFLMTNILSAAEKEILTVSRAVDEALANNPIVREYDQIIQSAQAGVESSRAGFFPKASAQYSYTGLHETPIMKTANGPVQTAHRHQFNWSINVIQPLFTGFALTAQYEKAKLEADIRRLEKEQTLLDLKRNVKHACYHLMLSKKLFRVAKDETAALTAHRADAQLYYDQELIPLNDLLRSEVALANSSQKLADSRNRVSKAEAQLNRLLNRPIDSSIQVEEITEIPQIDLDYNRYAIQAITERPLMKSVQISLKSLGFVEEIAKSTMFPEVALIGAYERSGDGPLATDNDYTNDYNALVSVTATWTFWDWGKARSAAASVNHQMKSLSARIESLRDQIRQEVKYAILDCEVAASNIESAKQVLTQARENLRITNLQYHEQVATSTDVLDAQTYLTQADSNYYNALYGYWMAIAELDRAVGTDASL